MDNTIASAKFEKIVKPIQRPISIGSVEVQKTYEPSPVTKAEPVQPAKNVAPNAEEGTDAQSLIPNDPWQTSPLFYELASFFNVESKFYEAEADKISLVTDWAITKAGSNKIEDIFKTIRVLEENLYKPQWGETRLDTIHKYLRIASKRDSFNKALQAFERGPMTNE